MRIKCYHIFFTEWISNIFTFIKINLEKEYSSKNIFSQSHFKIENIFRTRQIFRNNLSPIWAQIFRNNFMTIDCRPQGDDGNFKFSGTLLSTTSNFRKLPSSKWSWPHIEILPVSLSPFNLSNFQQPPK